MADYKVTDAQLSGIANAIRSKGGTSEPLAFPSAFVSAIQAIPSGVTPSGSISISQNGTYDVSAFADAVVNVSGGGGGSNDNFKIAIGAMSGSVYDTEVSKVGRCAFYSNDDITGVEMTSVLDIYQSAFANCPNLVEASFPELVNMGKSTFYSCTGMTKLTAPKVTYVGSFALSGCFALQSISFPLLSRTGQGAFNNCRALSEVILPEFESNEYGGLFSNCYNLALVSLPKFKSIVASTFYNCSKLESLYLLSETMTTLTNTTAFGNTPMSNSSYLGHFGSIYVPSSLVETYKAANNWSLYADRITAYVEE